MQHKNEIVLTVNSHIPYEIISVIENTTDLYSYGIEYNRQLLDHGFAGRLFLGTGVYYRNYGFRGINKNVPYLNVPLNINMYLFRLWKFYFFLHNSFEFCIPLERGYQYPDPAFPSYTKYQLFLHKNNAICYTGSLSIRKFIGKHFFISLSSGLNIQLDKFDAPYQKNIGAIMAGVKSGYQF